MLGRHTQQRHNSAVKILDFLPFIAMAGVGLLFLLIRIDSHDACASRTTRAGILALVLIVFVACCAAAAGSGLQIARVGLAGTPPPSTFGAVARLVGVAIAIALWPLASRLVERAAIFTFVVGAGASGLIGLGLRSGVLDAARSLYHLLMFACGAILAAAIAAGFANGVRSNGH
jgi:hypothetical protein